MTDKLSGIKAGDRVRVTFEGEVDYLDAGGLSVKVAGGSRLSPTYGLPDIQSPHFHIERIEKPLKVGDHVRGKTSGDSGEIVWMSDTHVVIIDPRTTYPLVKHISNVERVS